MNVIEVIQAIFDIAGKELGALFGAGIGAFVIYLVNIFVKKSGKERLSDQIIHHGILQADITLYKLLAELLLESNASRAQITMFHNGNNKFDSMGATKLSMTHELVRAGVTKVQQVYTNLELTLFPMLMNSLLTQGFIIYSSPEETEPALRLLYETNGSQSSVLVAIRHNIDLVGYVSIIFLDRNDMLLSGAELVNIMIKKTASIKEELVQRGSI